MKKFAVICLALLYTVLTSGFTVNVHYCMGQIASVKWHTPADEACGICGMTKKHGCCQDEVKFCKVQEDHQSPVLLQQVPPAEKALVLPELLSYTPVLLPAITHQTNNYHAPPIKGPGIPLYLHHCTFLI